MKILLNVWNKYGYIFSIYFVPMLNIAIYKTLFILVGFISKLFVLFPLELVFVITNNFY